MIFNEKNIVLKNGKQAILKTPCIEDAEMLLNSIKISTGETEFLSRTMEDWESVTVESEETFIHNVRESQNTLFIACYVDGVIAGNCDITFKTGGKSYTKVAYFSHYFLKSTFFGRVGNSFFFF